MMMQTMMKLTVVMNFLFAPLLVASDTLPDEFVNKFNAKCLDGSAPQFEVQRNTSSTKWLLFLEGGGWCYGDTANLTKQSCAGRAGSSWPPTSKSDTARESFEAPRVGDSGAADIGGIMSQDSVLNPDFYTWNKIFMHYCDGASFGGNRADPIPVTKKGAPASMYLRGRAIFDADISYFQTTLGMDDATEVILSGGSAGGLAVYYNLDHFATLLKPSVRLTGFPDAGFFLDAMATDGTYMYRNKFIGADSVWNVTGGKGTNLKCLENEVDQWKCLMAPYIIKYIETPIFVLNAGFDAWQMEHVLATQCIPKPGRPCTDAQNVNLTAFHAQFVNDVSAVTDGKPKNGVFLDSCYVHEQNVNYCSNQGMPNCVGWSPLEPGSIKWNYSTSITVPDGRSLTPQQAFGAYYRGDAAASIAIDKHIFFDNPSCVYTGAPPKPVQCTDFEGNWTQQSSTQSFQLTQTQNKCYGSFMDNGQTVTFTAGAGTLTTSKNLTGKLVNTSIIQWSDGTSWSEAKNKACVAKDFGGHLCPTSCSGMTDISSTSITTSAECIAACCADPKIKVCTYAGFQDATKTCVVGDWHQCASCRKGNGWTTTLINYGPPSPSPPPPPTPPTPPSPPTPPTPPSPPGNCSDFSGKWTFGGTGSATLIQKGCSGSFNNDKPDPVDFTVVGSEITCAQSFYKGLKGMLVLGTPEDKLEWSNHQSWLRAHNGPPTNRTMF